MCVRALSRACRQSTCGVRRSVGGANREARVWARGRHKRIEERMVSRYHCLRMVSFAAIAGIAETCELRDIYVQGLEALEVKLLIL